MSYPTNEINDVLDFYARDHGKPLARAAAHYRLRRALYREAESTDLYARVKSTVERWDNDRDNGQLFVENLTEDLLGLVVETCDRIDREVRVASVNGWATYDEVSDIIEKIRVEVGA